MFLPQTCALASTWGFPIDTLKFQWIEWWSEDWGVTQFFCLFMFVLQIVSQSIKWDLHVSEIVWTSLNCLDYAQNKIVHFKKCSNLESWIQWNFQVTSLPTVEIQDHTDWNVLYRYCCCWLFNHFSGFMCSSLSQEYRIFFVRIYDGLNKVNACLFSEEYFSKRGCTFQDKCSILITVVFMYMYMYYVHICTYIYYNIYIL